MRPTEGYKTLPSSGHPPVSAFFCESTLLKYNALIYFLCLSSSDELFFLFKKHYFGCIEWLVFITSFLEVLSLLLCYMILNYADKIAENLDKECWGRANTSSVFVSRFSVRYLWPGGGLWKSTKLSRIPYFTVRFVKYSPITLLIDLAHFLQPGSGFCKIQYGNT